MEAVMLRRLAPGFALTVGMVLAIAIAGTSTAAMNPYRTFGPGEYPNLPPNLRDRISSGRRISNEYPYNAQPVWR